MVRLGVYQSSMCQLHNRRIPLIRDKSFTNPKMHRYLEFVDVCHSIPSNLLTFSGAKIGAGEGGGRTHWVCAAELKGRSGLGQGPLLWDPPSSGVGLTVRLQWRSSPGREVEEIQLA